MGSWKLSLRVAMMLTTLLAGAFLGLATGALATVPATAAPAAISMGSGSVAPGGEIELGLQAQGVPAPGMAAVTVTISYDSQVVDAVGCTADPADVLDTALCTASFEHDGVGRDAVRIGAIDPDGVTGDVALATIRFRGKDVGGVTSLQVMVDTFSDPDGQPMEVTTAEGSVAVAAAAGEAGTPTPVPGDGRVATPTLIGPAGTPIAGNMELVTLAGGTCNLVTSTYPDDTAPTAIAGAVSPAGVLRSLWAFAAGGWHGYSPQFPDVSDLTDVDLLDVVAICVSSDGAFSRPRI